MNADQLDFMKPLLCERESALAGFVADRCIDCGCRIVRHEDRSTWRRFVCIECFVATKASTATLDGRKRRELSRC